jgi:hypothetical protein
VDFDFLFELERTAHFYSGQGSVLIVIWMVVEGGQPSKINLYIDGNIRKFPGEKIDERS